MRKIILTLLTTLFLQFYSMGQSDITVLNGYKYIYLAPLSYQDGSSDKWGIRNSIKEKLIASGIKVIETTTPPADIQNNTCLIATCTIDHTNNIGQPIPDYVYLKIINCDNQIIYSSQGAGPAYGSSYQRMWKKATDAALKDIRSFKYGFDKNLTFELMSLKNLPSIEMTGLTEDSIKSYLTNNKTDQIEGIYKSYQTDGMPYYKIGIIKSGYKFKAVIIESDLTYWKMGEVKAVFEQSSMKGLYSVKWYMGNKTPYETFGNMENEALLNIELKDQKSGDKRQDKFIKMFPVANNVTFRKDNSKTSGSGFFISTSGIIATNAHVVEGASNIEVTISNEIDNFTYKTKVLLSDSKNDVALLQIDDEKFKGLSSIPYRIVENSEVGSKVFTIGYPLNDVMGSNYKVTDGIISSKSGIADDVRYYQISVPLQPGNSGGPLFNQDGNIIGITSARLNSQAIGTQIENVNYAIKSSYLLNLYNMVPNSTKFSETSQVSSKELQEQVKILKNYVCLIKVF